MRRPPPSVSRPYCTLRSSPALFPPSFSGLSRPTPLIPPTAHPRLRMYRRIRRALCEDGKRKRSSTGEETVMNYCNASQSRSYINQPVLRAGKSWISRVESFKIHPNPSDTTRGLISRRERERDTSCGRDTPYMQFRYRVCTIRQRQFIVSDRHRSAVVLLRMLIRQNNGLTCKI